MLFSTISVIMPLLKHELWSSIQSDWERAGRIAVAVNYCNYESRGDTKRFVFHCRGNSTLFLFFFFNCK